ncbi:unnamed protein product [Chrysodeixis includens]|uniref:Uncharacterized protein n=1 Tax=Chrysodeixis includens TaxID=689277 RepID=A0A9N8KVR1_CHRIL|nr:unnamed protein product [Chrysodeixis includens]
MKGFTATVLAVALLVSCSALPAKKSELLENDSSLLGFPIGNAKITVTDLDNDLLALLDNFLAPKEKSALRSDLALEDDVTSENFSDEKNKTKKLDLLLNGETSEEDVTVEKKDQLSELDLLLNGETSEEDVTVEKKDQLSKLDLLLNGETSEEDVTVEKKDQLSELASALSSLDLSKPSDELLKKLKDLEELLKKKLAKKLKDNKKELILLLLKLLEELKKKKSNNQKQDFFFTKQEHASTTSARTATLIPIKIIITYYFET